MTEPDLSTRTDQKDQNSLAEDNDYCEDLFEIVVI
jgi:hypothetical protein